MPDGRAWSVEVLGMAVKREVQDATVGAIPDPIVQAVLRPPRGDAGREFTLNYSVICHEVMNHIAQVHARSDWAAAIPVDQPVFLGAIQYTINSVKVQRPPFPEGNVLQRRGLAVLFSIGLMLFGVYFCSPRGKTK